MADKRMETSPDSAVTGQQLAAKAIEVNSMKNRFMANITHEIRTPLNGIIGIAELLAETTLSDQQQQYTEIIRQSSNALLSLVDRILDFSKIEEGTLRVESRRFSLHALIYNEISAAARKAKTNGNELGFLFYGNVPEYVIGDERNFRQILFNLLDNAVKFTKQGSVFITFRAEPVSPTQVIFKCIISDTGIGIPQKKQLHLFTPFLQGDNSSIRRYGGIGLGLVLSQRLLKLMDGSLNFESSPGKGSTFTFSLPVTVDCPDISDQKPRQHKLPQPFRALLVGMKHPTDMILRNYLSKLGGSIDNITISNLRDTDFCREQCYYYLFVDETVSHQAVEQLLDTLTRKPPYLILVSSRNDGTCSPVVKTSLFTVAVSKPVKAETLYETLIYLAPEHEIREVDKNGSATAVQSEAYRIFSDKRVVIAEDNQFNQVVLQMMLKMNGIESECVENGRELLELCSKKTFDLIIMDLQMPVMDGLTAAKHIRAGSFNILQKDIPIVACTATTDTDLQTECSTVGIDVFLLKPIHRKELASTLKRIFKTSNNTCTI